MIDQVHNQYMQIVFSWLSFCCHTDFRFWAALYSLPARLLPGFWSNYTVAKARGECGIKAMHFLLKKILVCMVVHNMSVVLTVLINMLATFIQYYTYIQRFSTLTSAELQPQPTMLHKLPPVSLSSSAVIPP